MSSKPSRRTPTPAEHLAPLHDALVEVAEGSFFALVDPCEGDVFAEYCAAVEGWLVAEIAFSGAFSGHVSCALPVPLARTFTQSMLGLDADETPADDQVADLVAEMTNMVCGAWLTRTCHRRRFELRRGDITRQPAGWNPTGGQVEHGLVLATVDGQPLAVELTFVAPPQGDDVAAGTLQTTQA